MNRYTSYFVRYTDADGIHVIRGWGHVNSQHCYAQWSKRVGEDVYRTEWVGIDPDGSEHVIQHTELRTDLYDKVQAPKVEQYEQIALL